MNELVFTGSYVVVVSQGMYTNCVGTVKRIDSYGCLVELDNGENVEFNNTDLELV